MCYEIPIQLLVTKEPEHYQFSPSTTTKVLCVKSGT
jgi:hypothetical protein